MTKNTRPLRSRTWPSNRYKNYEKMKENSIRLRLTLKMIVLEVYGGRCKCCGFSNPKGLVMDHVNGGGGKEHNNLRGIMFWRFIIESGFPTYLQILCAICNHAKGSGRVCPIPKTEHK